MDTLFRVLTTGCLLSASGWNASGGSAPRAWPTASTWANCPSAASPCAGCHPPLIDQTTFDEAQRILAVRGEDHAKQAAGGLDYLLTGLIRCPACGSAMLGTRALGKTKTYRYYSCHPRTRYDTTTCGGQWVDADAIEQAVTGALADFHRHQHGLIADAIAAARPRMQPSSKTALSTYRHWRDDVRVMQPVSEALKPVLGRTSWLVKHGHGSFITMEYGEPRVDIRKPLMVPVSIAGAPAKTLRRFAAVHGEWHLWIYCCEWSLQLEDVQLAHSESDDITMNRALAVLNGQALQAVDIEPADGRTRFTFDLGCSLLTYPAPPGTYEDPVEQWMLLSRPGSGPAVLSIRGDGTYSIGDSHEKPGDRTWLPIAAPVHLGL